MTVGSNPQLEELYSESPKNLRHLGPEKRNSKDTAKDPQAAWPLVVNPRLVMYYISIKLQAII